MSALTPRAAIDAFVAAMRAKDLQALLDHATNDILLIGSERHEVARGRDALRALLANVMSAEASYGWDLTDAQVSQHGDMAWFAADTMLEARSTSGIVRTPYRLTGILLKGPDARWRWCHFHGSEPARPQA